MTPKLSVIIPTYNEEKYLPILLERLQDQTYTSFEIIVADNNSKDRTTDIATSYGVRVVRGGNLTEGRNRGAKKAKGDILIFLDADTHPESTSFLETIATRFTYNDIDIASCYFQAKEKHVYSILFCLFANIGKRVNTLTAKKNTIIGEYGCCVMVKRNVFFDCGMFNEQLIAQEDSEFFQRTVAKGYRYDVLTERVIVSGRRFISRSFISTLRICVYTSRLLLHKLLTGEFTTKLLNRYVQEKGRLGG